MKKPTLLNFHIQPKGIISQICLQQGLLYLEDVMEHLKNLPYGRTSEKRSLGLVLTEGRGTCSAKHALIAQLAHENGLRDLRLALCTYNMSDILHEEVGAVLRHYNLKAIPEARCFLKYHGAIYNLCGRKHPIQPEIVSEIEIAPLQIGTFKKRYHRNYIESWLQIEKLNKCWSPDQIWSIREECIEAAEENWESRARLLCCA